MELGGAMLRSFFRPVGGVSLIFFHESGFRLTAQRASPIVGLGVNVANVLVAANRADVNFSGSFFRIGRFIFLQNFFDNFAVMSFLFFTTVGSILLSMIRALLLSRIRYKLNLNVSAATMMRILSLPASFFKAYSAGELNQYISYMDSLCATIVDSVFSTAVTGVFSLLYITQIFAFAPSLVLPSLAVTVLTLAVSLLSAWRQMKIDTEKMTHTAKERGLVFSLITSSRCSGMV